MQKYRNTVLFNLRLNRIVLIIFTILTIASVLLIRYKLLENAQELGSYLAWNYASEEQNNITIYKTFVELGIESIDKKVQEGADTQEIHNVLSDLFENISQNLNNNHINLYAIVNGNAISLNPDIPISNYDYLNQKWYKDTINSNGEIVYSDVYKDSITGELVLTISKKSIKTNDVLSFDIFIKYFHMNSNISDLPNESSYFLCDKSGNPLFYTSHSGLSYSEASEYSKYIFEHIKKNYFNNYKVTLKDPNGIPQGVYYYEMSNGWISILTIPLSSILDELHRFVMLFGLVFFSFFAIIIFMTIRNHIMHSRISHITDTVQVLGDSYYAIYKVNYENATYETIKSSSDVEDEIGFHGNYQHLLDTISKVVDESTFKDFDKSFSIENIRHLVDDNIKDYGGYYQRLFNNIPKWVNIRMLIDKNLLPNEVVICFRDVDNEKKTQLQHVKLLESALEAARENEKSKTAFFSSMSHDMRTPLNVILNLVNLIKDNADNSEKVIKYIRKVEFSSNQLLTLINDLLEISRLEHTGVSLSNELIDLKKCVQDCTGSFTELAKNENKIFNVFFEIQNSMVITDPYRINQILNNLLSNAFKYSESGDSVSITIKQCNNIQNSLYQIIVSDTGLGISEEFLPHIFDSYTRENRFGSKNIIGSGLGMPIVQRLVHQMGGEITIESTLGVGSTFTITLPFKLADDNVSNISKEPSESIDTQEEKIDLNGIKILLAEDNEINMEIATEVLQMQGIKVYPATNGLNAFNEFSNHEEFFFDAILMDMLMPEMDGCEASKAIRSLDRIDAKTIPIIAVTANAFAEDIAKTTEAGMNAHISKPIDFNILCKTLQKLIKSK